MSESARRGVLESQGERGYWAVKFADKSHNIRVTDLKLLPSDTVSFEPSQAPLGWEERQASAREASKRGLSVAASTKDFAECPITLMAGTMGPAFASRATLRGAVSSNQELRATGPCGLPTRAATSARPTSRCCHLTPPRSSRRKLP